MKRIEKIKLFFDCQSTIIEWNDDILKNLDNCDIYTVLSIIKKYGMSNCADRFFEEYNQNKPSSHWFGPNFNKSFVGYDNDVLYLDIDRVCHERFYNVELNNEIHSEYKKITNAIESKQTRKIYDKISNLANWMEMLSSKPKNVRYFNSIKLSPLFERKQSYSYSKYVELVNIFEVCQKIHLRLYKDLMLSITYNRYVNVNMNEVAHVNIEISNNAYKTFKNYKLARSVTLEID